MLARNTIENYERKFKKAEECEKKVKDSESETAYKHSEKFAKIKECLLRV